MLVVFFFYWSITHHNYLKWIKIVSNRSKSMIQNQQNNWSNRTLSPFYNILLVAIVKQYKKHYLYQNVVFCRNICLCPFRSFQRLNFSCTVGCGGWKIPQMDNLWTGSPDTRGYRSRCCWRFSSHVVSLGKKQKKWWTLQINYLYYFFFFNLMTLHFRLKFFFCRFLFQKSVPFKAPGTTISNEILIL